MTNKGEPEAGSTVAPQTDWPEIAVCATPATVEELEQWLFAAGAVSVTLQDQNDQPILEPAPGEIPLWDEITLVGLFAQAQNVEELSSALYLAAYSQGLALPDYELRTLPDAVWERAWMDNYQPMQFGPQLWVCPSHKPPPDPNAVIVHLDPGLAFGTGTHATTALCLEWLGRETDKTHSPLEGTTVVDYGCGSGVLAIAAAKLGAKSVYAVDIDDQALLATRQNAAENGVLDKIHIAHSDSFSTQVVDIVIANILFEPLTQLADRFATFLHVGGTLLMSGILEEQVEQLGLRYNDTFEIQPAMVKNGWALLTAARLPK